MQDQNYQDNRNNSKFYCRIEVFCKSNLELPEFDRDKCFLIRSDPDFNQDPDYDVFAREFHDFGSVTKCLYEIESAWKFSSEGKKEVSENWMGYGTSIMIYNKWGLDLYIGMYKGKWLLSNLSLYTNEWKENYARSTKNRSGGSVILYIPFYQDENIDEFISKERVYSLLKKWLEANEDDVDFDEDEMIRYLNEIHAG